MKKVTSVTFWNDAVGKRLSITYSEIDDTTGKIIRDNYRIDRVLVDKTAVAACDSIADVAQAFIDVQVLGSPGVLRTAVIFFYLSNEGVSLLENAAHLGLLVPDAIKTVLEQLHDRADGKGDQ